MRPPRALISSTAILVPFAISLPSEAITPPVGKMPTTLTLPRDPPPLLDDLGARALPASPQITRPPTAAAPPTSTDRRVTSRRVNDSLATSLLLLETDKDARRAV